MLQKKKKILEFMGSMLISALVFSIIYKFIPIVYSTNDDRMIGEIISGQFTGTPESYAIQMSYGFTWFLSRLYQITRSFNWYGIALIGAQIFSFGTILYRLQSFTTHWKTKFALILGAIGAFAAFWLKVYVQMTYTTTAAFVGLAAIFWYAGSKTDWKNVLMTGILANLAFSIRPNVFYMLLPATGLVYLWKLIGKKEFDKLTWTSPVIILFVTAGLFLINASAYSNPEWKEFMKFFDDRTQIYDYYDLADFEEAPELYEPYGIDKSEYDMIRVYNYTIMGDTPKEFFPQYIEAYQQMEKQQGITVVSKTVNAVKTFSKDLLSNEYGIENTLLFVIAIALMAILIFRKEYLLMLYLTIHCLVNAALWLYFTYWERAIERIQVSMSLIFLAVLLHIIIELVKSEEEDTYRIKKLWIGGIFALTLLWGIAGSRCRDLRYENIDKANRYTDVQTIKEYCAQNPELLYYMDVATMTELYGRFTIKNIEPEYINYIQLGDWSAYSPHYEKKLKNHGVEQIADTITDENTYVIMLYNYQVQCMKDYLGVEEHWEETIFGANDQAYAVYQFEK